MDSYRELMYAIILAAAVSSSIRADTGSNTAVTQGDNVQLLNIVAHVHTTFSTGELSVEEIARLARENDIDAIILTDHALLNICYDIPLVSNWIDTCYEKESVFSKGIERYLNEIERVQKKYTDITIIPGVEVIPEYKWSIDLSEMNLHLWGIRQHLLVFGSNQLTDYRELPVIGNPHLSSEAGDYADWITFAMLAVFNVILYRQIGRDRRFIFFLLSIVGSALTIGIGAIWSNWSVDSFDVRQSKESYQKIVDYSGSRDLLTFWPHVERPLLSTYSNKFLPSWLDDNVKISYKQDEMILTASMMGLTIGQLIVHAPGYVEDLVAIDGYTGFSPQGRVSHDYLLLKDSPVSPGSTWDRIMNEYAANKRGLPAWVWKESDYHIPENDIDRFLTVVWAKDRSRQSIMNALRDGRMYGLKKGRDALMLHDFYVVEPDLKVKAVSGDLLKTRGEVEVRARISCMIEAENEVRTTLIKSGDVVHTYSGSDALDIRYVDRISAADPKAYYRLIITSLTSEIITNPIQVTRTI